ncbi:MFS transporter [Glaciimonas soli]|uniref:MFS transporter n=1 Tax=Glaciimonas soli TaxID=2590999 RepID=A0A843YTF9_9BURK|nr:MFS transporter [Glaciimonas soli]MQR00631.1 MFS transporter [Glaciimonas soli]
METEKSLSNTESSDKELASTDKGELNTLVDLLKMTPFRNVWIASTISLIGDVCFMVALPWLVLQLTGSSLALGSVMMALAVPRALLLLIGGAMSDKFPARTILAMAYSVQLVCVGVVSALIWYHSLHLNALYILAFCFGIADAFTSPALRVLLPELVPREQLPRANSLLSSTSQVCLLGGAAIVGLLIAKWGLFFAFFVDTISYVFIIFVLFGIAAKARTKLSSQNMRSAIAEGLRYVWSDTALRSLLTVMTCINFCMIGATQVGFAALANSRFESSADFGFLLMSAGIGSLIGIVLAGSPLPKMNLQSTFTTACLTLSFLLAALAIQLQIWGVCIISLSLGIVAGYVNIQVVSWLQATVRSDMLGRVMSVLALGSVGIAPLSLAISGLVAQSHVHILFLSAGAILFLTTLLMGRHQSVNI